MSFPFAYVPALHTGPRGCRRGKRPQAAMEEQKERSRAARQAQEAVGLMAQPPPQDWRTYVPRIRDAHQRIPNCYKRWRLRGKCVLCQLELDPLARCGSPPPTAKQEYRIPGILAGAGRRKRPPTFATGGRADRAEPQKIKPSIRLLDLDSPWPGENITFVTFHWKD